jgi:signal transduction histidine kinase
LKDLGKELFQDTAINFEFAGIDEDLKQYQLSMEYSRNIVMICKELLNNTLKHSEAKNVCVTAQRSGINQFRLEIADDGKGFDQDKITNGHGINNIKARALRIKSSLKIETNAEKGSVMKLFFDLRPDTSKI